MKKLFTQHPASVDETYLQHFLIASKNGAKLVLAGIACLIHSVFPFLFKSTASKTVHSVNQVMISRKLH